MGENRKNLRNCPSTDLSHGGTPRSPNTSRVMCTLDIFPSKDCSELHDCPEGCTGNVQHLAPGSEQQEDTPWRTEHSLGLQETPQDHSWPHCHIPQLFRSTSLKTHCFTIYIPGHCGKQPTPAHHPPRSGPKQQLQASSYWRANKAVSCFPCCTLLPPSQLAQRCFLLLSYSWTNDAFKLSLPAKRGRSPPCQDFRGFLFSPRRLSEQQTWCSAESSLTFGSC